MYYVQKRMEIAGSHRLQLSYPSKCTNLHGHNWIVTVYCRSEQLNADGMVVDFKHIKDRIHGYLDHGNFNELLPFNPTAENIARWIVEQIPQCYKASVQESEGNVATYCTQSDEPTTSSATATGDAASEIVNSEIYRVNEIFYSLQGEGYFTGTPAVFIRLSGCNLACDFCDTDHHHGREMTLRQILHEVGKHPARHVVITGGEPTMQLTLPLIDALHRMNMSVQIETNGSMALSSTLLAAIDWVTCSPKQGMMPQIQRIDELKVVYDIDHTDYVEAYNQLDITGCKQYCLQPCDRRDPQWRERNLKSCIDYILSHPRWRLSLQTHKIIDVR